MNLDKLRICQIVESAATGVGRHVMDLTTELIERQAADVHVIWSPARCEADFSEWLKKSGVTHSPLPMRREVGLGDLASAWGVRSLLKQHGPFDIVHGHSSKGGALARLAARGLGSQVIYTPHAFAAMNPTGSALKRAFYGRVERELSRWTTQLIVSSPEEKQFGKSIGIPLESMTVVANGMNRPPLAERDEARAFLGLAEDQLAIGFIGRLADQKNPLLLLDAFHLIAADFPKACLVMVGDGPLETAVRSRVAALGLRKQVLLTGRQDGWQVISAFDMLALPSRYEGLAYVSLEALHAGLPLVVTESSSCSLVVEESANGFVVFPDPRSFAEAMARILCDEELRLEFGRRSAEKAGEFSIRRLVDGVMAVYHSAVAQPEPKIVELATRCVQPLRQL
jgi:glycosyltransferase involved in cell wall biosynthesis